MKLIAMALFLLSLTAGFALEGWETDRTAACKQAAAQNKDLMIVYQGQEWKPGQPGRPESMLESPLFRDKVCDRFVLLEQRVKEGEEVPEKMVLLLADAQGRPFYGVGDASWENSLLWVLDEINWGREQRKAVLPVVEALEKARPEGRKREVEKLKNLLSGVCFNVSPAAEWSREFPFEKESVGQTKKKLEDFFKGNIADPSLLHWRQVFMAGMDQMSLLSKLPKPGERTEDQEKEHTRKFEKKLDQLIAERPGVRSSRFADIVVRDVFRLIPIMDRIGELKKKNLEEACKQLLAQEQLPGWSVENRQLLSLLRASCLLKKGDMEQGLALIDEQVKRALWTANGAEWAALARRVRENRGQIDALRKKSLQGNEDAEKERNGLLGVFVNLNFKFDVDLAQP